MTDIGTLRSLLAYNPQTGELTWKERDPQTFANTRAAAAWNARFAGQPAFQTLVQGYLCGTVNRRRMQGHRVAFCLLHGRMPNGEVDHINGHRTDNRASNLREVSSTENKRNAARPRHNTSGIVGVSYRPDKGKWRASITLANRAYHIGYFATCEEAVAARKAVEARHGFHPNHGRVQ